MRGMFSRTLQSLGRELDDVFKQMTLCLENMTTQSILSSRLFKMNMLEEVKRFIREVLDEENIWNTNVRNDIFTFVEDSESRVKLASSKKSNDL